MTLFTDRDEMMLENLRILNSRFIRKKRQTVRGERPSPFAMGGSAPTLVIAPSNASDSTKKRADLVGLGPTGDQDVIMAGLQRIWDDDNFGRILLTEGDHYIGAITSLLAGVRFEGMGKGATRIHTVSGSNAGMWQIPVGDFPIEFANLTMNGNKSLQSAGTLSCISLLPNGASSLLLDNVDIYDFRSYGILNDRSAREFWVDRTSIHGCGIDGIFTFFEGEWWITDSRIWGNTRHGIKADAASVHISDSRIHTNGDRGFSAGGIFQGNPQELIDNVVYNNGGIGIELNAHDAHTIGNRVYGNGGHGIAQDGVGQTGLCNDNICIGNGGSGIALGGTYGGNAVGNVASYNQQHGILVASGKWHVADTRATSNGRATNNTYDGIHCISPHAASLHCNVVDQDGSANKQRYGINVAAGAVGTWRAGNDCRTATAFATAAYVNAGAGTIDVWAGGTGDNQ